MLHGTANWNGIGNGNENSSRGRCLGGEGGGGMHARIKQRTRMWPKGLVLVARTRHLGGGCCACQRYRGHNNLRWGAPRKIIDTKKVDNRVCLVLGIDFTYF